MLKTRLTLMPGANGTKRLVARYGNRLVCVRYRYDAENRKRIKTVELIEEETPWLATAALYLVKIAFAEAELREKAKAAGAKWDAKRKLWLMSAKAIRRLNLEDRVTGWLELDASEPIYS
jgi:hypothetical protein